MPAAGGDERIGRQRPRPTDPFAAFAGEHKAPVDVEARLAGMRYGGQGDTSIHATQLQCTGALLRQGIPLEDVVAQVLAATKRAVAGDARCAGWDWREEEITIERMCVDLINKDHTLAPCLPTALWERFQEIIADRQEAQVARNGAGLHVRVLQVNGQDKAEAGDRPRRGTGRRGRRGSSASSRSKPFDTDPAAPAISVRAPLSAGDGERHRCAGGLGKTSIGMVEAVAMATARNLLDEQPRERCRVWLHNGEDRIEELRRRRRRRLPALRHPAGGAGGLALPHQRHRVRAQGRQRLQRAENRRPADQTRLPRRSSNSASTCSWSIRSSRCTACRKTITARCTVLGIFTRIANVCNCAIDIAHHTRKLAPGG